MQQGGIKMPISANNQNHGSYVYRFKEKELHRVAQIWSIGWDEQTSPLYNWDLASRKDHRNCIFQYTISGGGEIETNGKKYMISPGEAFIVDIPQDFRYRLPSRHEKWEFIYITLFGDFVHEHWKDIQHKTGQIIRLHPESKPIQLLTEVFDKASKQALTNGYEASAHAYQFTMNLIQYLNETEKESSQWPDSIIVSTMFVKNHYQNDISATDMAEASGLSRYHFTRQFKEIVGETPVQYINKIRIQRARELLQNTKNNLEDISKRVGYSSPNYFNKVFRSIVGMTPGDYRKQHQSKKNG
jgi:AraC-like DNA-binding protein/mannose-6-phosphate isomerase-like protein (cupin superfamily)